jgi:hypothetical protein
LGKIYKLGGGFAGRGVFATGRAETYTEDAEFAEKRQRRKTPEEERKWLFG